MLGEFIKQQIREQEMRDSDARYDFLCRLPKNTFAAIYYENFEVFSGARYNGVYYSEYEIYFASLAREEGYEEFL
ncbi:hypothetical protein RJE46_14165 [Cedecea neteri]|uniref:hypothetical protein n=1 Tax=Cedecea neteri TaxID=158822 RepID=UPI0028934FF3|nr:hypothetical protein [Cedecea neteri]WNJ77777.1 hypothetical protein RJE46_14165 [Cedecea neteri]